MKALRILIVEDDALIGDLLAEMLTGMGHRVCAIEATETGAVLAASQHRPDLMIVDARLARGTGVSAVETILRTEPVPYLFISGGRIDAARSDAVVLQKPFREPDLVRAIERTLGDRLLAEGARRTFQGRRHSRRS
ncbi:MAG: response regulator [Pseudomonadota bacterium]|nr:response regulator [Pseudomonadota bacterium]